MSVNLKQLSEYLGISQTTVSRGLNGFPEVAEKTRQRILKAAEELDYRPSPGASGLATGQAKIIGHVLPTSAHMMINPHFADFVAGANEVYSASGYDMMLRLAAPDNEVEIYREYARHRRVDGVVVHGPHVDDPRIALLQELGLPFIVHGRSNNASGPYAWLDVNNKRAFERAVGHLVGLGHSAIALVNGLEAMNFAQRRRSGFEAGLEAAGLLPKANHMTSGDLTEPYGYRATRDLMATDRPPTAIVYASVLPALGGVRALGDMDLKVGRDVSIVIYDDQLSFLEYPEDGTTDGVPHFTSLRSSLYLAGRRVAELLLERISQPDLPPAGELWEAQFVPGQSSGPPPVHAS